MAVVMINPSHGGSDSGNINGTLIEKNYNLEIAKNINEILNKNGITSYLLRTDDSTLSTEERLELVKKYEKPGEDNILLTLKLANGNDSGAEIIYALRNSDKLASNLTSNIKDIGYEVLKYYQLRSPDDTSKDYYEIIREPINTESLILSLGYVDNSYDNNFLLNNKQELSQSIANGILDYLQKGNIYIVKKGDTLYQIAKQFGVSVTDIKALNNLTSDALTIGQELIIPKKQTDTPPSSEYLIYQVKAGDTLYSIARKYNTTIDAIKNINNLTSNNLSLNQILKIPTTSEEESVDYFNYTVKSGDSLYKIANLYNTTVNEIVQLNNLSSINLSIGQVLKIPNKTNDTENKNYFNYTVKSGDSLYKIANLYNTTVQEIRDLNNLTSNNLQINQVLKIPINNQEENFDFINYTVKSGDSLYKIANLYNTTVQEIIDLNNLTSTNLQINQVLKIPKNKG